MTELAGEYEEAKAKAESRRAAFLAAIPKELLDREDAVAAEVVRENASARSKLKRVYRLIDEIAVYREEHVACRQGCSACCRMNVTVSALEAEAIAAVTGRLMANVTGAIQHPQDRFVGSPCPFLSADQCSIYESRPLACRKHASHFTSEKWCSPPHLNSILAPLVHFSGVEEALAALSAKKGGLVYADIRDFFGSSV